MNLKEKKDFIKRMIKKKNIDFMTYALERYEKDSGKKFENGFGYSKPEIKRKLIHKLETRFKIIFDGEAVSKNITIDDSMQNSFDDIQYENIDQVENTLKEEIEKYKASTNEVEKKKIENKINNLLNKRNNLLNELYGRSVNRYLLLSEKEKKFYDFILDKINYDNIQELKKGNWNVMPLEDRKFIIQQISELAEQEDWIDLWDKNDLSEKFLFEKLNFRLLYPDVWPYFDNLDYLKYNYSILFENIDDDNFKKGKETVLKKLEEINKILENLLDIKFMKEKKDTPEIKDFLQIMMKNP